MGLQRLNEGGDERLKVLPVRFERVPVALTMLPAKQAIK